ncbi:MULTISPECIES: hypothetical protein [Actinomyces]|uniref:hypothetical protein n=1 Tax=Actinomyces TaxID=1654 RepID=UPI0013C3F94C|nr:MULTISPECIES: hypothetical protein [Actinomyces]
MKPAPAANPRRPQSTAARRRTHPGATSATTSRGTSLPGSSTKAARAILAPSSWTVRPTACATSRVASATTSAQAVLSPSTRDSRRTPTVRVRASSPMTSRQPIMKTAGTIATARRGTRSSAATSSTSVTTWITRVRRASARTSPGRRLIHAWKAATARSQTSGGSFCATPSGTAARWVPGMMP